MAGNRHECGGNAVHARLGLPQCPGQNIDFFDMGHNGLPNQSSAAFVHLDSFGNAQTLIHLTELGLHTLQTSYLGDNNFTTSGTTISVTVAGIELDLSNSFLDVEQGGQSTINLSVLTGGYNGPINFDSSSCVGLPSLATCSFSPGSITGGGPTVITVSTRAPTFALGAVWPAYFRWRIRLFWLMMTMAVVLLLLQVVIKHVRISHFAGRLGFACLLMAITGCRGGSNSSSTPTTLPTQTAPGTPKGAYVVTINANSGGFSAASSFTLNIL